MIASVSIFFIIARGIEFGDVKVQKWLTSLIAGFFSSIFVIQPIKVEIDAPRTASSAFAALLGDSAGDVLHFLPAQERL